MKTRHTKYSFALSIHSDVGTKPLTIKDVFPQACTDVFY